MRAPLGALLVLAAAACSKPEPPTFTPEEARVTSLSTSGIGLAARFDAWNPNGFDIAAEAVDARFVVDGKIDLGTVRVTSGVKLPGKQHTKVEVPLSVKWGDLGTAAQLALQNRPIPYQLEGTVAIGSESIHVNVPFKVTGTITHEQLVRAGLGSLPKIPGLDLGKLPQIPGLTAP